MRLAFDGGGSGDRLLVFLHGLGATRHVWQAMTDAGRWNGRWIAPDLRGHGNSPHTQSYTLADHAGDVGELVQGLTVAQEIVVVGHSMGGAVALALASGAYGFAPARVFGLSIKVAWTSEELARMGEMASTPARIFASQDEAADRYLKVAGLVGLVDHASPAAAAGIARTDGGWRLSCDPATASVGAPPMQALLDAARSRVHLARGANDRMMSLDQLKVYDAGAADIPEAGHNAMVERPLAVWDWVESRLT
jgi:pimeloyl-ACP methyl ester carboxylesterase